MSAFADQTLSWAGKKYQIPARKMLGAIARVEEVITLRELCEALSKRDFPLARISQAYGAVLRYAGADLDDEVIYEGMFSDPSAQVGAMLAIQGLMEMMIPPSVRNRANGQAPGPVLAVGESDPSLGNSEATAKPSSKPTSRSRSRKDGARH